MIRSGVGLYVLGLLLTYRATVRRYERIGRGNVGMEAFLFAVVWFITVPVRVVQRARASSNVH